MKEYRICKYCVMDTTDPLIQFNEEGICNHCREAIEIGKKIWFPNDIGQEKLDTIIKQIKVSGQNKKYDAIIGISGGVDSSYMVYKAKEWGLRILALHVDAGWNRKVTEDNVRAVCEYANFDLKIVKVNWEDMRKMQLAFLKAAVPNQDIPQDHVFFSILYSYAVENDIQYIFNGSNWATENILPSSWGYNSMDGKHIKDIYSKYGEGTLCDFPFIDVYKVKIYFPYIKKMKIVKPLNLIPYNKNSAMKELEENTGWRYYGGKHYESIWTKFFQSYYLPTIFNFDKRRAHLSSLIVSGQITREEALKELELPAFNSETIEEEKKQIADKLEISVEELNGYLSLKPNCHSNYHCTGNTLLYKTIFKVHRLLKY